jgi:hypothetical protein
VIRTFIDSGVLIQAIRGEENLSQKALNILADSNREFVSSIFLKMEVLPKAIYNKQSSEAKFYQEYFDSVTYWAMDINQIILNAYREASQYGLGAMDALHIASAVLKQHRYLIILDDVNYLFSPHKPIGTYQSGYENYNLFFKLLTETKHQSCIIANTSQKIRELSQGFSLEL